MLWKNKPVKIGKTWEPIVDSYAYLKARNPDRLVEIEENSIFPFFFRLLEEPFKGWIIEIVGIEEKDDNMSFLTIVDLIPKEISDKDYKKLQKKLNKLLSNIVNDIIINALNSAEEIINNDTRNREGNPSQSTI